MTIAVVAEKPSVARDLAQVLGAHRRGAGTLSGNGYVVTWAIGHLVGLAEPHQIRAEWKKWRREQLPMLPAQWPLVVLEQTAKQFEVVREVLASPEIDGVVCATDAGREGELIFRLIYEAAGCRKPVKRLWISSLTEGAIRDGFARLRPQRDFDRLADAALGRSRADWLVGMNLSRAYGLLARRAALRRAGADADARDGRRARAGDPRLRPRGVPRGRRRRSRPRRERPTSGRGSRPRSRDSKRLPPDGEEAARIVARAKAGRGGDRVDRVSSRSGCRRRCSTTSPSCSGTRTGSSASPRSARSRSRRRSTSGTSCSATRAPTAGTSRPRSRARSARWSRRFAGPTRRSSRRAPANGRSGRGSSTTRG